MPTRLRLLDSRLLASGLDQEAQDEGDCGEAQPNARYEAKPGAGYGRRLTFWFFARYTCVRDGHGTGVGIAEPPRTCRRPTYYILCMCWGCAVTSSRVGWWSTRCRPPMQPRCRGRAEHDDMFIQGRGRVDFLFVHRERPLFSSVRSGMRPRHLFAASHRTCDAFAGMQPRDVSAQLAPRTH